MSKHVTSSFFVLFVALFVVAGCDDGGSTASAEEGAEQEQASQHEHGSHEHEHDQGEDHAHDHAGDEQTGGEQAGGKTATVEVPDDGTEFDPAVTTDQLPEGAWHCDMNDSVHYAAMNEGDGECPLCGMNLIEAGSE